MDFFCSASMDDGDASGCGRRPSVPVIRGLCRGRGRFLNGFSQKSAGVGDAGKALTRPLQWSSAEEPVGGSGQEDFDEEEREDGRVSEIAPTPVRSRVRLFSSIAEEKGELLKAETLKKYYVTAAHSCWGQPVHSVSVAPLITACRLESDEEASPATL